MAPRKKAAQWSRRTAICAVSFTPKPAGTRWYHTHSMAMDDVTKGAYSGQFGFLYVEPKSEPGNYDQEIFLASRHWEPKIIHRGDPNNDWNLDYASATLGDRASARASRFA